MASWCRWAMRFVLRMGLSGFSRPHTSASHWPAEPGTESLRDFRKRWRPSAFSTCTRLSSPRLARRVLARPACPVDRQETMSFSHSNRDISGAAGPSASNGASRPTSTVPPVDAEAHRFLSATDCPRIPRIRIQPRDRRRMADLELGARAPAVDPHGSWRSAIRRSPRHAPTLHIPRGRARAFT